MQRLDCSLRLRAGWGFFFGGGPIICLFLFVNVCYAVCLQTEHANKTLSPVQMHILGGGVNEFIDLFSATVTNTVPVGLIGSMSPWVLPERTLGTVRYTETYPGHGCRTFRRQDVS